MTDAALPTLPDQPPPAAFTPARPPRFWRVRRFLASLNPVRVFLGPVFQRDVRVSGRRKGTYATRLILLAIPTGFVTLIFLATVERYGFGGSAAARIQSMQNTAFMVANTIAWCQLVTLALVAPLLTAGSIVEERTARALSAIAASPLTPGRVVGGLFAARMVNLGLLALLPLPLILAIRMFGGLETSFVLWSFAISISNAVAIAAVGLWASTRATRPATAVTFAILFLILYWIAPLIVVWSEIAIASLQGTRPNPSFSLFVACPPAALFMLSEPPAPMMLRFSPANTAAINCVISLAIGAGALLWARWNLARLIATDRVELARRPSRREKRKVARAAAQATTSPSDDATPSPATIDDDCHSRTVTGNPVLWRELRQPLFASTWKRRIGVFGIVAIVIIIHVSTLNLDTDVLQGVIYVPSLASLALMLLSAAATPAGSITTELEAQTWAVLLTTPLKPIQILLPKVAGAMRRLWPAFLFLTLHLIACVVRGLGPPGVIVFALLHLAVYAFFLSCTGVFFSLCCRKSAIASTFNISLILAIWLIGPIFLSILLDVMGGSGRNDLIGVIWCTNPMVLYMCGFIGMFNTHTDYDLPVLGHVSALTFYTIWLISLAVYTGLAGLVLLLGRRTFHRLSTARI